MLKTRIIPTLLMRDGQLVKGQGFNSWRRVGSPLPAIKVYCTRLVDELMPRLALQSYQAETAA
jgi:imidazole glycerol-phosphate synthase subunit HisF